MSLATEIALDIYYLILLCAAITATARSRAFGNDRALRVFALLLWLTVLAEGGAWIASYILHSSQPVYAVFNPLQLLLAGLYFNALVRGFRKWHIGEIVGGVGIVAAVANAIWLQPIATTNSNMLVLDGLATVCMALWFFARLMLDERPGPGITANPHFLLATLLIFFWAVTFCSWAGLAYYRSHDPHMAGIIHWVIMLTALMSYGGFLAVLLRYPKMQPHTV